MTRILGYNRAIREALSEEMDRDPTIFYMGEDVGALGGVFGLTKGLQEQFGKTRVFDTPISETLIVGAGVGAALTGARPIVELQYSDFVAVAMDEIYNRAAKWRYMHGGKQSVPLTIVAPEGAIGGVGAEHSQCPEALFWSCPGLYVVTPSSPAEAKGLLKSAIRNDNPVLYLPHKALGGMKGPVPEEEFLIPLGKANIVRPGRHLTIVAWSIMVGKSLEAAARLSQSGIETEVIDARGIRPFDFETVLDSVRKTGRLLIAHEAPVRGGAGAEVAAEVAEKAMNFLEAPILRVGAPDIPIPQSIRLEKMLVPGTDDIVRAALTITEDIVSA